MAEPTEADRAKAGELCKLTGCDCGGTGAIAREVTRAEHGCDGDESRCASVCPVPVQDVDYDACELHAHFAAALAEASEEGERRATGVLHDVLSGAYAAIDPDADSQLSERLSRLLDCDGPGPCREYQRSMDEAEERGRRACWDLAERCRAEREVGLVACVEAGGAVESLRGKLSEAERIRDLIAARGPMGEP